MQYRDLVELVYVCRRQKTDVFSGKWVLSAEESHIYVTYLESVSDVRKRSCVALTSIAILGMSSRMLDDADDGFIVPVQEYRQASGRSGSIREQV